MTSDPLDHPIAYGGVDDHEAPVNAGAVLSNAASPSSLSLAAAVAAIMLVAIDLRPAIVSMGPLLPQIQGEFGISNTQASLLTAIPALLMGLLAFPAPWLAHKFGRDSVILAALVTLMLATALRAFAGSPGMLLLSTIGIGAGIAIAGALVPGFAKKSFPKQAALLMGLYAMALGLGSTLAAGLTIPLAELGGGWRSGAGLFALPCLVSIAAWLIVARAERRSRQGYAANALPARRRLPFNQPMAWLIAVYAAANNILFFGFVSWTAPLFREYGMSATTAGLLLASFTAAFMFSNPVAGFVSRHNDRRVTIGLFAVLTLVGSTSIAIAPDMLPFLFIPMVACGIGGSFTLGMVLPLDHATDAEDANAWTAFVIGIGYSAGAVGPLLLGVLRDGTGDYGVPLWLLAGVALTMLGISPFLQPPNWHIKRHA